MSPGSPQDGGHYFRRDPWLASRPRTVALELPDLSAELSTDSGVFSASRIDPGTKLLLAEMAPGSGDGSSWPEGDLVDLGCGYGPITVALALRESTRRVWAVDTNDRALELTRQNADRAGVGDRVRAVSPRDVPADLAVAAIVSNPPIRVGKAALHAMLLEWTGRLHPGGEAWLVVQKNLGADSLARWLGGQGLDVERIVSRRGYRVLRVMAGGPDRP